MDQQNQVKDKKPLLTLRAVVAFVLLMALKKLSPDEYHPLGPYIVLAAALTLCFRPVLDNLVQWYLSLL